MVTTGGSAIGTLLDIDEANDGELVDEEFLIEDELPGDTLGKVEAGTVTNFVDRIVVETVSVKTGAVDADGLFEGVVYARVVDALAVEGPVISERITDQKFCLPDARTCRYPWRFLIFVEFDGPALSFRTTALC